MPVVYIRPIARVRPPVGVAQGYSVETADCTNETLPSAPSAFYDLLLFILSALFVPSVMLFCIALWFGKFIRRRCSV